MASERPRARGPDGDGRPPRILLADRDLAARSTVAALLRNAGHLVEISERALDTPERALRSLVDVVVLALGAPGDGSLEACRLLKAATGPGYIPVLVLAENDEVQDRVAALRAGADDCMARPFDGTELLLRIGSLVRTRRSFVELARRRGELEATALLDESTGLPNQRAFLGRLAEEWKRAERHKEPLSCAFVELDRSRAAEGAKVDPALLRAIASVLRRSLRDMDFVARGRSDELLVLLPNTHFTGAAIACERMARKVRELAFDDQGRAIRPTVSIGVALFPSRDAATKEALLRAAEGAAARANAEGGDTVFLLQHQGYVYSPSGSATEGRGDADRDSGGPPSVRSPLDGYREANAGPSSTRMDTPLSGAPVSSRFEPTHGPASTRFDGSSGGPPSTRFDGSSSGPSSSRFESSPNGPPSSRIGGARRPSSS